MASGEALTPREDPTHSRLCLRIRKPRLRVPRAERIVLFHAPALGGRVVAAMSYSGGYDIPTRPSNVQHRVSAQQRRASCCGYHAATMLIVYS